MAGTPAATAVVEQVVESVDEIDADADANFDAGFDTSAASIVEDKPRPEPVKPVAEAPVKTEPVKKPAAKPAVVTDAKIVVPPKYVQITQEQFDALQAAAAKTATFDQRIKDTVGGHVGELEQRIIRKLQAATQAGAPVELPADVVAELDKEFPEIAKGVRQAIERALKGIRGTAPNAAAADKAADPDAIFRSIEEKLEARRNSIELEDLVDDHPKWRDIVGIVDAEGRYDPNNKFRQWLSTQSPEYQKTINETQRPSKILRAINRFQASQKPAPKQQQQPAPKVVVSNQRFRGAIQPKGDGGAVTRTKPTEDDFDQGFREESRG